ncbi:hypothetical protein [Dongia sp. agr-C8]
MARSGGRATAVAVDNARSRKAPASAARIAKKSPQQHGGLAPAPEPAVAPVTAKPAFHERSLAAEGLAATFRVDAGSGWATGSLPAGAGENEIAKFLGEAMGFAKQMQAAMGGPTGKAAVEILIVDPEAGPSRQSAITVAVEPSGAASVTLQSGGGGHRVAMLQHFLMALSPASRDAA